MMIHDYVNQSTVGMPINRINPPVGQIYRGVLSADSSDYRIIDQG